MTSEQAKGKPVDRRADIWAFGVVFYELLTGRKLFEADDVTETLAAVVLRHPEWEDVPPEVRRLLKKCLEKDPKKRLRDIGDVWELLEESGTGLQPVLPPSAPSLSRLGIWAWAAAGVFAAALAALAFVHFRETPPSEHVLRYTIAPPEGGTVHSFAVSPDGRSVVMASAVNGKRQLWQRPLDGIRPTNPGQARAAFHLAGVSCASSDSFLWARPGRTASR
ncbi:MAG: protein kinase [Acidobacteriia bacterium]|nr:protein kinase [Terriglobia bacterium]